MTHVRLITSVPLVPPWDQGDKNLAYGLTTRLPQINFQVLTTNGRQPQGENLQPIPVFTRLKPSLHEKILVYLAMLFRSHGMQQLAEPQLYHLFYQPTRLSSWMLQLLPDLHQRPKLHTIPATGGEHHLRRDMILADRIVTMSHYGLKKVQALGLPSASYIPPGVDTTAWEEVGRSSGDYKVQLGLNARPVVLYPGHFSQGYGARMLLEGLQLLVEQVPDVCVIFACRIRSAEDRLLQAEANKFLADQGLREAARIYETVPDMRVLIGAADLTVLPFEKMSNKVDLPTTLLESLAAGKPVVISDLEPMNEIFTRADPAFSQPGCLVPAKDAGALIAAVLRLLMEPEERFYKGRKGQQLVHAHYNLSHTACAYQKIYLEMIA